MLCEVLLSIPPKSLIWPCLAWISWQEETEWCTHSSSDADEYSCCYTVLCFGWLHPDGVTWGMRDGSEALWEKQVLDSCSTRGVITSPSQQKKCQATFGLRFFSRPQRTVCVVLASLFNWTDESRTQWPRPAEGPACFDCVPCVGWGTDWRKCHTVWHLTYTSGWQLCSQWTKRGSWASSSLRERRAAATEVESRHQDESWLMWCREGCIRPGVWGGSPALKHLIGCFLFELNVNEWWSNSAQNQRRKTFT